MFDKNAKDTEPKKVSTKEKKKKENLKKLQKELEKTEKEKETLKNTVIKQEEEIKLLKDQYIRLKAEFQNYSKRLEREYLEKQKYLETGIFSGMIPFLNHLFRAKENISDQENNDIKGLLLIFEELLKILSSRGLEIIIPADKEFDPVFHEAMGSAEDLSKPENICLSVVEPGYIFKNRVIHPARVIVNKYTVVQAEPEIKDGEEIIINENNDIQSENNLLEKDKENQTDEIKEN